jgi:DeoR family transcriptional regulator, glycerol-3-phosphate regulon repressor
MTASKWQTAILDRVRSEGGASIAALAASLNVSGETIRRHVRPLVNDGLLVRSHGAVQLADAALEPAFSRRMGVHAAAKRAIARATAALVPDGATVMIDTGSTTAYVAQALVGRRALTVITNSIEIARPLVGRSGHRVYIAGGEIRADLSAVVGPEALDFLAQFRADLAILSIGAIDPAHGFTDFHLDEARIARTMRDRADRTLIAADASKFSARAAVPVCSLGEADSLVTDARPRGALAEALAEFGVEVIVTEAAA